MFVLLREDNIDKVAETGWVEPLVLSKSEDSSGSPPQNPSKKNTVIYKIICMGGS